MFHYFYDTALREMCCFQHNLISTEMHVRTVKVCLLPRQPSPATAACLGRGVKRLSLRMCVRLCVYISANLASCA